MSFSHYLIQGILPEDGRPLGVRHEFSSWTTSNPEESIQVSLFIRALQRFYDTPYYETSSYFQIASIHGFPGNLPWDNAAPPTQERKIDDGNLPSKYLYCTHERETFPTWHRAYLLLFEQLIWENMGKVIDHLTFHSVEEKQLWKNERNMWRLPYWDWALDSHQGNVPALFMPETIQIRAPTSIDSSQSEPNTVSNPLYRYQLRVDGKLTKMGDLPSPYKVDSIKDEKGLMLPWAECSGTSRWGIRSTNPEDWSEGVNNHHGVPQAINKHEYYIQDNGRQTVIRRDIRQHSVTDLVYRLLSNVTEWKSFATTAINEANLVNDEPESLSLEFIHNSLHDFIGGENLETGIGHMQNVPVAAFDPIFFMHHCNIDRIFAVWQVLHPNAWFDQDTSGSDNKTQRFDKLTPFHHKFKSGRVDYFQPDDLRYHHQYGYQYDCLQRSPDTTDEDYLKQVAAYVDKNYNKNTGRVLLEDEKKVFASDEKNAANGSIKSNDYLIDVTYNRHALDGHAYKIHFFLVPEASTQIEKTTTSYNQHRYQIGSIFTIGNSQPGYSTSARRSGCVNCQNQRMEGVLSTAQVPLTLSLYDAVASKASPLQSMEDNAVESYLTHHLRWVATKTDNTIIPWEQLEKTKVYVLKGQAEHFYDHTRFSTYRNYRPLPAVTRDKEAGARQNDYDLLLKRRRAKTNYSRASCLVRASVLIGHLSSSSYLGPIS